MLNTIQESLLPDVAIAGVEFKDLKTFPDDRGFFRELVRGSDSFFGEGFAQWSHSKMAQNTVKAWHFHHRQVDWWYMPLGLIHTALIDNREESPTFGRKIEFLMGETELDSRALTTVVRIPQGVLHGCKVLSPLAHLFYITSQIYDPADEGRIPFDDPKIAHHWGDPAKLIVADRDRKPHLPPYPRSSSLG